MPEAVNVLLVQDARLATISDRMRVANDSLCRQHMPVTGIVIHTRDQYRVDMGGSAFANGPVAISLVVPGSVAERAGLQPGDGIASIGGQRTSELTKRDGDTSLRDPAHAALEALPTDAPVILGIVRDGQERSVSLDAPSGCRALVEVQSRDDLQARSDGHVIWVSYGLASRANDGQLAAVFAHELGHTVLEHRRRLVEAGVTKGLLAEFGKNRRLSRIAEVEADRISVHLLANAGYNPEVAPELWRSSLGRSVSGGILHSRIYPSAGARADLIEQEIREHLANAPRPSVPSHLMALRDQPFPPR